MKHDDDVQGAEFVPYHPEIKSDDDGVEYDAEFQDQEGGDLLLESRPAGFCSGKLEFLRKTLLGVIFCAMAVGLGSIARRGGVFSVFSASDGTLDVLLCDHTVSHLNVALRSKVQQEDQHD